MIYYINLILITARRRFDDFNNSIEPFRKMQSGEMKLEEAKKLQNVFK